VGEERFALSDRTVEKNGRDVRGGGGRCELEWAPQIIRLLASNSAKIRRPLIGYGHARDRVVKIETSRIHSGFFRVRSSGTPEIVVSVLVHESGKPGG